MNDNDEKKPVGDKDKVELARFDTQINRVCSIVAEWGKDVRVWRAPFVDEEGRRAFSRRAGLMARKSGRATIVPADECAVELGAPGRANVNMVLWTTEAALVRDGEIRLLGPDMPSAGKVSWPYAQVILVALNNPDDIDPFQLESAQYLSNRLPGFMVRTVPGRLWARVSRDAISSGMDFARLGGSLIAAYREDFSAVSAVEILFVTLDDAHVNALESVAAEARIILGKNKKLVLVGNGEYECTDLDCDDCEEQETCDEVRDIVILRRKRKKDAS